MRRWIPITAFVICWSLFAGVSYSHAQQDSDGGRRVVSRVTPTYPAMARTLRLSGTVKVEVLVEPNGSVKSLQIKGGHPVLAQAAEDAVRKWKWAPAKVETKEPVTVKFEAADQ